MKSRRKTFDPSKTVQLSKVKTLADQKDWARDDLATFEKIEEVCNVGDRLYKESKKIAERKEEIKKKKQADLERDYTFKPTISKMSQDMTNFVGAKILDPVKKSTTFTTAKRTMPNSSVEEVISQISKEHIPSTFTKTFAGKKAILPATPAQIERPESPVMRKRAFYDYLHNNATEQKAKQAIR